MYKREDGYHLLETIMQTVALYDGIYMKKLEKPEIKLKTNLPWLPVDERNLAWKAANLMRETFGIEDGVFIEIDKRIPVAAGLAGYVPYYIYRQKNTVGNFENVGYALPGAEGLYNIYMMEEVHSIFAAGAGAVTKLVDYAPAGSGKKSVIQRLFNDKYPYEYLNGDGGKTQAEQIVQFYRERGF